MEIPAGSGARHGFGLTSESENMGIRRCYKILKRKTAIGLASVRAKQKAGMAELADAADSKSSKTRSYK